MDLQHLGDEKYKGEQAEKTNIYVYVNGNVILGKHGYAKTYI